MRQWRSDDTSKWREGFGRGRDGSSYSAPANAGCSGTAASTTLTLDAASTFANGDLVLIHQTRGSNANSTTAGVVNWELNKIVSGGGTTTLTLKYPLDITYADSGASQAQIIEMKEYENLTLSGTITPAAWDGNKGGIGGFFNKGTLSGSSAILSLNGSNGNVGSSTQTTSNGGGFRGGEARMNYISSGINAISGEGTAGAGTRSQTAANGNGGGAGTGDDKNGGGGGNASTGASGSGGGGGAGSNGTGGAIRGVTQLTRAVFGGGGGGGTEWQNANCSSGGNGGGIWFIFSENINLSGITVRANGGNSPNVGESGDHPNGGGGGGAGGSILFKAVSAVLGTTKATASAGSGLSAGAGNGSVGRIHVDYSGSISGTTNPTLSSRQDTTIKPAVGGGSFLYQIL